MSFFIAPSTPPGTGTAQDVPKHDGVKRIMISHRFREFSPGDSLGVMPECASYPPEGYMHNVMQWRGCLTARAYAQHSTRLRIHVADALEGA
jgi:hypothetical protein